MLFPKIELNFTTTSNNNYTGIQQNKTESIAEKPDHRTQLSTDLSIHNLHYSKLQLGISKIAELKKPTTLNSKFKENKK